MKTSCWTCRFGSLALSDTDVDKSLRPDRSKPLGKDRALADCGHREGPARDLLVNGHIPPLLAKEKLTDEMKQKLLHDPEREALTLGCHSKLM